MTRYLRSEEVGTPTIARRRVWPLVTALLAGLLALGILVMCLGNYQVAPSTVAKILVGQIPGIHADVTWPRAVETVVLQVRLPRTLGAMCVGAALALSGVIVAGLMNSTLGLFKYIADPETELADITYWMMGSFSLIKGSELLMVAPVMALAATILFAIRWRINLLSLGDQQAKSLGVSLRSTRLTTIVCSTALTGCAVCISGTVGWVGLVVPHIGRLIAGPDNTRLLPVSAVVGGIFMLVIDTLARTLSAAEIPLSILTGFIGAPLYIWLLYRNRVTIQ